MASALRCHELVRVAVLLSFGGGEKRVLDTYICLLVGMIFSLLPSMQYVHIGRLR